MYQKIRLTALLTLAVMTSAAYATEITDVMVRQRWPWSRKVDIDYVLECQIGGEYDIEIKAYNGEVPLSLPMESISGDVYGVKDGTRRIIWDPTLTQYAAEGSLNNFRVELSLTPVPLYMIVDLTKGADDPEQIKYVYEDEIVNGGWGTWERNPVSNDNIVIESVIWTGVTNDIYKTEKLVLRRIPATGSNGYLAGAPIGETGRYADPREAQVQVVLTKPFYLGVYQVTQRQWAQIMGMDKWPSYFNNNQYRDKRPVETVSWHAIRGSVENGCDWPNDGHHVFTDSFIDKLRNGAGNKYLFDLPTEAQWEYACRAGIIGAYNVPDTDMDDLGRYAWNGGSPSTQDSDPDSGTAIVGKYFPNAWGLFDMHGNVYEWCLDWKRDEPGEWYREGGVNPVGAITGSRRIVRGGYRTNAPRDCRSAARTSYEPGWKGSAAGFRLAMFLP